jgi:hypothetical protein
MRTTVVEYPMEIVKA